MTKGTTFRYWTLKYDFCSVPKLTNHGNGTLNHYTSNETGTVNAEDAIEQAVLVL